ncbi:MAG: hypothetical protein H6R06_4303 [Proteobacteria bacterium]|jgi:tetratricopeptide (TPR) repeat protein|nr:hypothetical protein [Pseudomonadota bacterium]
MMEAESTGNFDIGIGTASLSWFVPLLRAQLLTVEGRYEEAIALFSSNLESAESQGVARLLVAFLADYAWCRFQLGQSDASLACANSCMAVATEDCDPDDLAASFARVAAIMDANERREDAANLRSQSRKYLDAHLALQTALLDRLLLAFPDGKWSSA